MVILYKGKDPSRVQSNSAYCPVGLFKFRSSRSLGSPMLTLFSLLKFKAPVSQEHSQTTRIEPHLCTDWSQTSLSCWIGITLQSQLFICYPSTPDMYSDNSPQVFRRAAELHCHNDGKSPQKSNKTSSADFRLGRLGSHEWDINKTQVQLKETQ